MTKTDTDSATGTTSLGKCPTCGEKTLHAYRPFCSKRCADIDLGRWFNGSYVIEGPSQMPAANVDMNEESIEE